MTEYCLGFMFEPRGKVVALIRKNKPAWQKGKLNGIGGKIEPGETPIDAMVREFQEEAGVFVPADRWTKFCRLHWSGGVVHVFKSFGTLGGLKTMTDEKVETHSLYWLWDEGDPIVPNLWWLIPMALDKDSVYAEVQDPS